MSETDAPHLHATNDLVAHYSEATGIPPELLEPAIGQAIDSVYRLRDAEGNMHSAGAAAAVAALLTLGTPRNGERVRQGEDTYIVHAGRVALTRERDGHPLSVTDEFFRQNFERVE